MSEVMRTPEARFANLPGFDFAPRYVEGLAGFPDCRVHYVDQPAAPRADDDELAVEQESEAAHRWRRPRTALCLHGHPTWSYLYRRMIPLLTARGYRVVAPDLPGFGRSDKPAGEGAYSIAALHAVVVGLVEALDLDDLVVVGHDWGGTLALTLPLALPERITGLVAMNCALPTGDKRLFDGVVGWRAYNRDNPDLNVPGLMAKANRILSFGECRAYGAPFPDAAHKAGVRALPALIPETADAPGAELMRAARDFLATDWQGASQLVWGLRDPVHGHSYLRWLHAQLGDSPKPIVLEHAGHFTPEWGDEFAGAAIDSIEARLAARRQAAEHECRAGAERGAARPGTP